MPGGLMVSGDDKHAKILIDEWGMCEAKGLETPLGKDSKLDVDYYRERAECKLMNANDAKRFRRGAARVNFMAQDRVDLNVASRIMSQCMATPREGDDKLLKRVIRYLIRYPKCESWMEWQENPGKLTVNIDSDWAGDQASRKSTSGGCIRFGSHLIHHWSKLQATVDLSSGEAELNAAVKGTSESIGIQEMAGEFCIDLGIEMLTDASVCKSILLRHGSGRIKHLSTKQLWVQGAVESYGIKIFKVPREKNPADLLTHGCNREDHTNHLKALRQYAEDGGDHLQRGGVMR
jgi:histone deacetylase 1/2